MPFADELPGFRAAYQTWLQSARRLLEAEQYIDALAGYPWVQPADIPFTQLRRPLSEARLGVLTTAGYYAPTLHASFNLDAPDGDTSYRVLPVDVRPGELVMANPHVPHEAAEADWNVVLPLDHLRAMLADGELGELGPIFSINGFALDAGTVACTTAEGIAAALRAAACDVLLVLNLSPICHQSGGLVARAAERAGIATVVVAGQAGPEHMRYPRTLVTPFGYGQPVGPAGDLFTQRRVLHAALDLVITGEPGEVRAVQ